VDFQIPELQFVPSLAEPRLHFDVPIVQLVGGDVHLDIAAGGKFKCTSGGRSTTSSLINVATFRLDRTFPRTWDFHDLRRHADFQVALDLQLAGQRNPPWPAAC
jgi:hypothetical protein